MPSLVALTLIALPRILISTMHSGREIDPDIVDAARGMGISASGCARSIELPLAVP